MNSKEYLKTIFMMTKSYKFIFYVSSVLLFLFLLFSGKSYTFSISELIQEINTLGLSLFLKKIILFVVKYYDLAFNVFFLAYIYFKYKSFILGAKKINYQDPYINILFLLSICGSDLIFYLLGIGALYINNILIVLLISIVIPIGLGIYLLGWYVAHDEKCQKMKEMFSKNNNYKEEVIEKSCLYGVLDLIRTIKRASESFQNK